MSKETLEAVAAAAPIPPPVLVPKLTEFETKYRVEAHLAHEFKRIMESLPNLEKFIYVEGPDDYYTNEHITKQFADFADTLKEKDKDRLTELLASTIGLFPPFMRYRRPSHGLDNNRQELTTKYQQEGVKNNVQREEKNIRVDNTAEDTVKSFVKDIGYKLNFSIWKTCHIYNFTDATLVFYSVYDTTNGKASKMDNFVEIEVSEELVETMTEEQAWAVITKYEAAIEAIGISAKNRLRKSLFQMYRREVK